MFCCLHCDSSIASGRRLALALAALVIWAFVSRFFGDARAISSMSAAGEVLAATAEDNLGITAARSAAATVEAEERLRLGPAKGAPKVKGARKPRTFPPNHEVNIMDWQPPHNAPQFDKVLWKDKVESVWVEVRAFELGGPPLRKFISEKVAGLKALRENLFAFVPMLNEEKRGGRGGEGL